MFLRQQQKSSKIIDFLKKFVSLIFCPRGDIFYSLTVLSIVIFMVQKPLNFFFFLSINSVVEFLLLLCSTLSKDAAKSIKEKVILFQVLATWSQSF